MEQTTASDATANATTNPATAMNPTTNPATPGSRPWIGPLAIVLVAVAAHGLWLFNDGVFYDAWLEWAAGTYGKWRMLQGWFDDSSMPQVGWLHLVMMRSPAPQATYALVGFACWVGVGLAVRATAHKLGATDGDATVAGMLVVASRIGCIGLSFIHVPYFMAMLALTGAAWLLVVDARRPFTGRALIVQRLLLYSAIFFMSMMPSCLMAFYVVLALAILLDVVRDRRLVVLFRKTDIALIPVVLFIAQRRLYPAKNGFENHNQLRTDGLQFEEVTYKMLDTVFWHGGREALATPLWLAACGAVVGVLLVARHKRPIDGRAAAVTAVLTIGWLIASIFPYVVVYKAATASRMLTWRHGLLLILVPALLYLLGAFFARRFAASRVVWGAVAGAIVAGQVFTSVMVQGEWLATAVKQRATIDQVKAAPLDPVPEVVWIEDRIPNPANMRTISYEETGFVSAVLGTLRAGGLPWVKKDDIESYRIEYFWYYLLPRFRGSGTHAHLRIAPRQRLTRDDLWSLGVGYAAARLRFSGAAYAAEHVGATLTPTEPPANWAQKLSEAKAARRKAERKKQRAEAARLRESGVTPLVKPAPGD